MPKGIRNWRFVDVKKFLQNYSFNLSHVQGSHYYFVGFYDKQIRQVCVPFHGSKVISPKTMKSIIRQSGILQDMWKL